MTEANAELIAAIIATMRSNDTTGEELVTTKPSRAQRSAANKSLNRQIQGQKGNITRAAKKGDKAAFVAAVQKADSLCPAHWETEKNRIKVKAEAQALVLNKVLATV
jgi:hypothetical protein